jgi:hypothetical protein
MNLWRVDFAELYRRHLCRHADLGLNVLHLIAVAGIDVGFASLLDAGLRPWLTTPVRFAILSALAVPWSLLQFRNVPWLTAVMSVGIAVSFVAIAVWQSIVPWWVLVLLIPAWHQFQQWGHRLYPRHDDMSAFQTRYPKGWRLSLLLAVYELPILVEFLRRYWSPPASSAVTVAKPAHCKVEQRELNAAEDRLQPVGPAAG